MFAPWAYPDGWAAVKLAHERRIPAVIKVHGCDILVEGKGLQHYRGRYQPTVDALCEADAIVAVSQHLADACIELGVEPDALRSSMTASMPTSFIPGRRSRRAAISICTPPTRSSCSSASSCTSRRSMS